MNQISFMDDAIKIWQCPKCKTEINISACGFFAKVVCHQCQHEQQVNTLLANYRLERLVGLGGMSCVYMGRDLLLEREVALKLLNDVVQNQDERMLKFERECSTMARVRHPNVASIYGAGRVDNQFYIAMELVKGTNVEDLIKDGKALEQEQALDIVAQAALGLNAAHQVGLLHRDMKPGNILLTEGGQAKVIDFGLSLQCSEEDNDEMIWATPFYVPPETLNREQEDLRTDIYALGMTLRHLLTATDSLDGNPATADELLIAKKKLPSICSKRKDLHPQVGKLIDQMTAFHPADRPKDYQELLVRLGKCLSLLSKRRNLAVYLRSSHFLYRILLCVGCGIIASWVASKVRDAYNHPPFLRIEALPSPPYLDLYQHLNESIAQSHWVQAYDLAIQLRESSYEAEFATWAALIACTLSDLVAEKSVNYDHDCTNLKLYLEKFDANKPARTDIHKDFIALGRLLNEGGEPQLETPLLQAMALLLLAKNEEGEVQVAHLSLAKQHIALAKPCYQSLLSLLNERLKEKYHALHVAQHENWYTDCKHLNFTALLPLSIALENNPEINEELKIRLPWIQQLCRAGSALIETLQGMDTTVNWASLSQEEMLARLESSTITPQRQEEVRCLCFLLQEKFDDVQASPAYQAKDAFATLLHYFVKELKTVSRNSF